MQEIYVVFDNKTNSIRSTTRVIDWIQIIFLEQVGGVWSSIKTECEDYVILARTDLKVVVNSKGKLDSNLFVLF